MKNLFLLLLFVISAGAARAGDVILSEAKDLTFKTENGLETVYDKNGSLYSGAVVLPDSENRNITYFYSNGKKNGVAYSKFADGKPELQIMYSDGRKNGDEVLFYANHNPHYKKTYKDDVLNGEELVFYADGKPHKQIHYTDGKLNGEVRVFNENGDVSRIENYKNGVKDGIERIVENNILRQENNYKNGVLDGVIKKYDTKYLTDEITYANGKKEGLHKIYSTDGSVKEILYKSGRKEGIAKSYNPDKTLAESTVYVHGKKNGACKKYGKKGVLISAGNYLDGKKEGIFRDFDEEGNLRVISFYADGTKIAETDVQARSDLQTLLNAAKNKRLAEYGGKKNMWYKILWLGLNAENKDILAELEKEMKMYALKIDDAEVFAKYGGAQFASDREQLFFGMPPLDYTVNIEAPAEIMQKFVSQKDLKNSRGLTPLRDAVRLKKTEAVKFLLLNGADVSETDESGNSILLYAVKNGAPYELTESILKNGADVNAANAEGETPFTAALAQNDAELLGLLLKSGAAVVNMPDGKNPLLYAYDNKAPLEVAEVIASNGADINAADKNGGLLLRALKNNDKDTALFALEHGADVDAADSGGETAVSYVLYNEADPEVTGAVFAKDYDYEHKLAGPDKMLWKILLEQNKLDLLKQVWDKMKDITVPDETGEVPLETALSVSDNAALRELALSYVKKPSADLLWNALVKKDKALFKILLDKGADANAVNAEGDNLLSYAVKNGYEREFEDIILKANPQIDKGPALDAALRQNDAAAAEYLLEAGAKSDYAVEYILTAAPDKAETVSLLLKYITPAGEGTLLRMAAKNLNLPLFEYAAAQKNADFGVTDDNGNTLLLNLADYFAAGGKDADAAKNFVSIAKVLLEKGADINARNWNGETLLIRMSKSGADAEILKFLQDNGANMELKDQYGKTAADYETENKAEQTAD